MSTAISRRAGGFAGAAHVVSAAVRAAIADNPMEPKSCAAKYDAASDTVGVLGADPGHVHSAVVTNWSLASPFDRVHIPPTTSAAASAFARSIRVAAVTTSRQKKIPDRAASRRAAPAAKRCQAIITRAPRTYRENSRSTRMALIRLHEMAGGMLGRSAPISGPLIINTIAAPTSSAASPYNVSALYGPSAGFHQHDTDHRLSPCCDRASNVAYL